MFLIPGCCWSIGNIKLLFLWHPRQRLPALPAPLAAFLAPRGRLAGRSAYRTQAAGRLTRGSCLGQGARQPTSAHRSETLPHWVQGRWSHGALQMPEDLPDHRALRDGDDEPQRPPLTARAARHRHCAASGRADQALQLTAPMRCCIEAARGRSGSGASSRKESCPIGTALSIPASRYSSRRSARIT